MASKITVQIVGNGGFELPAGEPTGTVSPSRLLLWPVGRTPPVVGNFTFKVGRGYTARKSLSSSLVFGVDLSDWLLDAGTALAKVEIEAQRGVAVPGKPFINGTVIGALVEGLSAHEGAVNSVTFKFTCVDGQQDSVTLFFEKG